MTGGGEPVRPVFPLACILLLAFASIVVFWPGLGGGFLLDDRANLGQIARFGDVTDLETLLGALGTGIAGPLGRPVALLSFLLNDTGIPRDAWDYKYTNVMLHAVNALLLFWLLLLLTRALGRDEGRALGIALLGAAFWALHPLWVSTTLYVVQRMAMLATTFSLAALILFVKGRIQVAHGRIGPGLLRIAIGLGGFGTLALFSKENAGLLPVQFLVLEVFLFRAPQFRARFAVPALYRFCVWGVFVLPSLALLGWLLLRWEAGSARTLYHWDITMYERALVGTQVFFEYLRLLLLPTDVTNGLYYDHIRPREWLAAGRLLLAHGALLALLMIAWWLRQRFAVGALAVAFFVVGHLVETWLTPLELAFEHRNYLPALLMFWPLAWVLDAPQVRMFLRGRGAVLLGGAILFFFASMTISRATLWGSPFLLSQAWVGQNPASERAHAYAAEQWMARQRPVQAMLQIEAGLQAQPENAVLALAGLHISCRFAATGRWYGRARRNIGVDRVRAGHYFDAIGRLLVDVRRGACPTLSLADVESLIVALRDNPRARRMGDRVRIQHLLAKVALARGAPDAALAAYRQAFRILPDLDGVLRAAATLGHAGHPELGLALIGAWEQSGQKISVRGTGISSTLRDHRRAWLLAEKEKMQAWLRAGAGSDLQVR